MLFGEGDLAVGKGLVGREVGARLSGELQLAEEQGPSTAPEAGEGQL